MIGVALPNALRVGHANPLLTASKPIEHARFPYKQVCSCSANQPDEVNTISSQQRRRAIASLTAAAAAFTAWQPNNTAKAIQGLTAGRIPGVSGPGPDGFYKYQRPEGKSGMFFTIPIFAQ
jgi:hypothetical protein